MRLALARLPLLASLALLPGPGAGAGAATLSLQVQARELVPGDLVRVDAVADAPLSGVEGTLRGEALEFVPACEAGAPCATWSAWAALDLDWPAGTIDVTATARAEGGGSLTAAQRLKLAAKSFPTSELKVEKKYVNPPAAAQTRIERENAKLAKIYAKRTPMAPPSRWERPVPGEPTGVFGSRRVFNGEKRKPHAGLDLRAATGTPVASSGAGTVALAEDLYFSGLTVIVDHGGGLFMVYAHLSRIDVKAGDRVDAGQLVGLSGATGRVTGPHLHWGGKVGSRIFDPTSVLADAFAR